MKVDWGYRGFVAFCIAGCLFIIGFATWSAIYGGPTKAERIQHLERQVNDLQTRVAKLESR